MSCQPHNPRPENCSLNRSLESTHYAEGCQDKGSYPILAMIPTVHLNGLNVTTAARMITPVSTAVHTQQLALIQPNSHLSNKLFIA